MLILFQRDATAAQIEAVAERVRASGREPHVVDGGAWTALLAGEPTPGLPPLSPGALLRMEGVVEARPLVRARPSVDAAPGAIRVGDLEIGGGDTTLAAGPCAVESPDQILETARRVREAGARVLRGGAFKFRTSPYDFQGLGAEGLEALAAARDETGLAIVTECLDTRHVQAVAEVADIIQVGARNMQNSPLLHELGRAGRPVLLKRAPGATLEEWLLAAEHVMAAGEDRIILCERGIRTFSRHSRFTLDLSVLPRLREETSLPVWIDPSHATGRSASVAPMARAAVAAGADGLLLEVHPNPSEALSDGAQALTPEEFRDLADSLRALSAALLTRSPVA